MVKALSSTPTVSGSNSGLCSKIFFFKLKRKISLHNEQPHVITQRNDIFYMMKKQPSSQRTKLVTPFQNGAPNSEKHHI